MKTYLVFSALVAVFTVSGSVAQAANPVFRDIECDAPVGKQQSVQALGAFDPSTLSPNADFPYLGVLIRQMSGYSTQAQLAKLQRSRRLMEAALNSPFGLPVEPDV